MVVSWILWFNARRHGNGCADVSFQADTDSGRRQPTIINARALVMYLQLTQGYTLLAQTGNITILSERYTANLLI
jgi:hypothetical protein